MKLKRVGSPSSLDKVLNVDPKTLRDLIEILEKELTEGSPGFKALLEEQNGSLLKSILSSAFLENGDIERSSEAEPSSGMAPEDQLIHEILLVLPCSLYLFFLGNDSKFENFNFAKLHVTQFGVNALTKFGLCDSLTATNVISKRVSFVEYTIANRLNQPTSQQSVDPDISVLLESISNPSPLGLYLFQDALNKMQRNPELKTIYELDVYTNLNRHLNGLLEQDTVDSDALLKPVVFLLNYLYSIQEAPDGTYKEIDLIRDFCNNLSLLVDRMNNPIPVESISNYDKETFKSLLSGGGLIFLVQARQALRTRQKTLVDLKSTQPLFNPAYPAILLECCQPKMTQDLKREFLDMNGDFSTSSSRALFSDKQVLHTFINWIDSTHVPSSMKKLGSWGDFPELMSFLPHTSRNYQEDVVSSSFPKILMFFKLYIDSLSFKHYFDNSLLNDVLDYMTYLPRPLSSLLLGFIKDHIEYYFDEGQDRYQAMAMDDTTKKPALQKQFYVELHTALTAPIDSKIEAIEPSSRQTSISSEVDSSECMNKSDIFTTTSSSRVNTSIETSSSSRVVDMSSPDIRTKDSSTSPSTQSTSNSKVTTTAEIDLNSKPMDASPGSIQAKLAAYGEDGQKLYEKLSGLIQKRIHILSK